MYHPAIHAKKTKNAKNISQAENRDFIKFLLENGADPEITDQTGNSLLSTGKHIIQHTLKKSLYSNDLFLKLFFAIHLKILTYYASMEPILTERKMTLFLQILCLWVRFYFFMIKIYT